MTHGIVVRVGADTSPVTSPAVDSLHELRIGIGTDESDISLRGFSRTLAENGITPSRFAQELLVLATAIFTADTRFRRDAGDDGWTRRITVSIPSHHPATWTAAQPTLERALRFLTGDLWTLHFRHSNVAFGFSDEIARDATPHGSRVALFSGGLDSFVGALDIVGQREPLVLVSHYTDGSASVPQETAFSHVLAAKDEEQFVSKLQAWIVAPNNIFGNGNDDRQRSRSFLFIALGVLVAEALGTAELLVPENGLISLNVPLTDLRVGSYSTRTTHPHYMSLLSESIAAVGIAVALRNPYQFKTKGEMLAECGQQDGLMQASSDTMSCAHPTSSRWRYKGAPSFVHCGRCTACLIRRAAFHRAFGNDVTTYFLQDLLSKELRSDQADGQDIRAVRMAARRVIDDPGIAEYLVLKPGPLPGNHNQYAEVYRRGMDELWSLVKDVRTRGRF
jgi:hypothetical protein